MSENNPTPLNSFPTMPDLATAYTTKGRTTYCIVAEDPPPKTLPNPEAPTSPIIQGATLCGKDLDHVSFDTMRGLERRGLTMHPECRTIYDEAYPETPDPAA